MPVALRKILFALLAVATLGASSPQLAPVVSSTTPMTMLGTPCDQMPCKAMTPACLKQIGCSVSLALPARAPAIAGAARFVEVDYWLAGAELAGVAHTPEPLPPRTT